VSPYVYNYLPTSLTAGSTRKEIKIRPGFTPQEDVKRFRGTRQAQQDANALPKGHIVGWTPPTGGTTITVKPAQSQSARKNAKRSAKRKEKQDDDLQKKIAASWEDSDEEDGTKTAAPAKPTKSSDEDVPKAGDADAESLANDVEKLKV
jgi:partner of Y14 and mago protein